MLFGSFLKDAPQPLKSLFIFYFAAFPIAIIGFVAGFAPVGFAILGAAAALLGLFVGLDIRDSAQAYSAIMKKQKPMGVDYSNSPLTNVRFIQFFGLAMMAVGVMFAIVAVTGGF